MDYLLDTNIISGMIKRNPKILSRVAAVTSQNREIFISCITYFEVERGLLAVDSPQQRQRFNNICQIYPIILLDDLAILQKAAEIHANLRVRGLPIQTEDILIAATAIIKGLTLVSNDSDLLRVEGLNLENWLNL
ncbi:MULTISPECIES: type II toxin-antitoxin system VapC family toxin [Oscillatoriales]|uniref:Ribonuclease VapC n=1 Tax=Laspinema palackyanum D2a TaxID=2953684 RepID=A0ABT2MLT4_9CYAN|nr:type II toxin-antitoxin system VapC family toxin [Oscillatoria sp. HE19RPO]MCT7961192.1 type II toxin-antitoxin system VapC family toxin [Laspinema sp. D2b]MCT7965697.1 type II toxin-antitoxin system VapC family toxin [Laspinema sp. D2a]